MMRPEFIVEAWENGERDLDQYLEKMGWESWLGVAELGLVMDSKIVDYLEDKLTSGEKAVLQLVKDRLSGNLNIESIEEALVIVRDKDTRDLRLEGRLRMERGLVYFESGEIEKARDDLTWAETRLKSVAKASRDHDISLLNKAAFHLTIDEPLMALHVHGEISRKAGHADETIAISRIQAARIHMVFGQLFDAARCAFNSHAHAIISKQMDLAVEAGAIFVEISSPFMDNSAEKFADQIASSKPRSAGEEEILLSVNPDDINGVFEWCVKNTVPGYGGEERPDLRALVMLSKRLDNQEIFNELLANPDEVDDALLAALCASISDEELSKKWTNRVSEIMTLNPPN